MKKRLLNLLLLISVLALLFLAIYNRGVKKKEELRVYGNYTIGEVSKYFIDAKGHSNVIFQFSVSGEKVKSLTMKGHFTGCEDNGYCIGKKYLVRYSSVNPKNCEIFFDKPIEGDTIPSQYLMEQHE